MKIRCKKLITLGLTAALIVTCVGVPEQTAYAENTVDNVQESKTIASAVSVTSDNHSVDTAQLSGTIVAYEWKVNEAAGEQSPGIEYDALNRWSIAVYRDDLNAEISAEELKAMLPKKISAEVKSADGQISEPTEIEVEWKDVQAKIPMKQPKKEYTVKAELPAGITLSTDANAKLPALTITFSFRLSDKVLDEHKVEGISPVGTRINLFDYWIYDGENGREQATMPMKLDGDTSVNGYQPISGEIEKATLDTGINKKHIFDFNLGGGTRASEINHWVGGGKLNYPGIVQKKLQDRYPVLNNIEGSTESLSYLFNPNISDSQVAGRASYTDIQNLLQLRDDGHFYFNSEENFAKFNEKNNSFTLYDAPAVDRRHAVHTKGQFFPFAEPNRFFCGVKGDKLDAGFDRTNVNFDSDSAYVNHHFGMTMTTQFVQENGGKTYRGKDITYEFAGDDDVWIFIDDVLVADLGGIHDSASLKIDFSTGGIELWQTPQGSEAPDSQPYLEKSTLKQAFEEAGVTEDELAKVFSTEPGKENTFADDTYHTLRFFYLERGAHDSNLKLNFNLIPIPESELIKIDQLGNTIEGVEFALYAADKEGGKINETPIYKGKTNEKGEIFLRDDEGAPLTFESLSKQYETEYFVLDETAVPKGYRHTKDILLHYDSKLGTTTTGDELWANGAYAQPIMNSIMPLEIDLATGAGKDSVNIENMSSKELSNLKVFAVVFKRDMTKGVTDPDAWLPVSGNAVDGWYVADDYSWKSIIDAAKANPYIFELENGGAFVGVIDNLPGDIGKYFNILPDGQKEEAEFAVGYYYSDSPQPWSEDFGGITEDNTYMIRNSGEFEQQFSSRLYVPNIKNRLLVHKVDPNEKALVGAKFSLYKESDLKVETDGTVKEIPKDVIPYDEVVTENLDTMIELPGGAEFPSKEKKVLENGSYWLVETEAPEGYERNEKAIKVVVDDSGVYADAGTKDDGVKVMRSLGTLVRSVLQLATNDIGYTTLHDVKAQLLTSDTYSAENGGNWSPWEDIPDSKDEMHLQHSGGKEEGNMLDYALAPSEEQEHSYPILTTETGWSKLSVRQCLDKKHETTKGNKQDLGNTELTNLFSNLCTVVVTDELTEEPEHPDPEGPEDPDEENPDEEEPNKPDTDKPVIDKPDKSAQSEKAPDTSDPTSPALWTLLLSAVIIAVARRYKKVKM